MTPERLAEIRARQERRRTHDGWRSPIVQGYFEDVDELLAEIDALTRDMDEKTDELKRAGENARLTAAVAKLRGAIQKFSPYCWEPWWTEAQRALVETAQKDADG